MADQLTRTTHQRRMNLMVFLATSGFHQGAWRRPDSRSDEYLSLDLIADLTRQAEAAKLDAIFIADSLGMDGGVRRAPRLFDLEPITALSALAAVTSRIGLIATVSTTFTEPFNLSRYFGSIDHLSRGRAGWNIVTSTGGGQNFSVDLPEHSDRYVIADEYLRVVKQLWDSWAPDAVVNDRESGHWVNSDRVRPTDFAGQFYSVAGPALVPRSPQGWPLLVQAGSSPEGMDFAARHAEVIFTAQSDIDASRAFRATINDRAQAAGRPDGSVRVLPGIMPIIGPTEAEARQLADELADLVEPESALKYVSNFIADVDLTGLELDRPIPLELLPEVECANGNRSRYAVFRRLAVDERYTLRELMRLGARGGGHLVTIGTAEQVANVMATWFETGACDGFNFGVPHVPAGFGPICNELVPILQERGLFRTDYEFPTLRANLGLPDPFPTLQAAGR